MGHVVQKSGISVTKVGQKLFLDVKLTEHYYCVACALLYSAVACLSLYTQKFLWSVQVEAT